MSAKLRFEALCVTSKLITSFLYCVKHLFLFGVHKGLDTMETYFARKRAEKAQEDVQFERMRSKLLGACRTCRILRFSTAKFYNLWAPLRSLQGRKCSKTKVFRIFLIKKG